MDDVEKTDKISEFTGEWLPYLTSLDAMYKAEMKLNDSQKYIYYEIELPKCVGDSGIHKHALISADTPTRAEAFLRSIAHNR